MSAFLNLLESIRDTESEIANTEQAIAARGPDLGLELAIDSLQRRLEELQSAFAEATASEEIDTCSYRLLSETAGRYPVAALGRAFVSFQTLFSVLYDVIKRGEPRKTAKIGPDSAYESTFDFGYVYSGSLGFVFTLPNERMLVGESLLDIAMRALMDFPQTTSTEQVSALAKQYGVAAVRLAYQWASAHVENGLSVELQWRRKNEVRLQLLTQVQELRRLTDLIASTSDFERETMRVYGKLVGIDVMSRTFHLAVDPKTEIRGSLHESFKPPQPFLIEHFYTARLELQTRIRYATDAEEKDYYLLELTPGFPSPAEQPDSAIVRALPAPDA